MSVDPRLSEIRRRAGAMGGMAKSIKYAGRQHEGTAAARKKYRQTYKDGKHYCRLCGTSGQFDPDGLLPEQRERAAENALQLHLAKMRRARRRKQWTTEN